MYLTWEEAKKKYKGLWVVFRNPKFADRFCMELIGGDFVGTTGSQSGFADLIPRQDDGTDYTVRHTEEDTANGLLVFGG